MSYGNNVIKRKIKQLTEKHYLEMMTMLQLLILEEEKENITSKRKLIRSLILLRSFKRTKREITSRTSPLINVTIVIRQDTFPEIVQQRNNNIRGRITKDIMLTQSKKKKKNLPRSQKKKKLKNMSYRWQSSYVTQRKISRRCICHWDIRRWPV